MRKSSVPYSDEIADRVLSHIEGGETFASIARMGGMPSANTLRKWQKGEGDGVPDKLADRFEKAMSIRLVGFVDDLIQIPRDIDPDHPGELQRARLECENRRWLLSKLLRSQFGDQSKVELGGDTGNPIVEKLLKEKAEREAAAKRADELTTPEERKAVLKIVHAVLQRGSGPVDPSGRTEEACES